MAPAPTAPASRPSPPRHLYALDALRGVAALTVVLWHWQHFYWTSDVPPAGFRTESQPLYDVFFLFYRNGTRAVDLFFLLSGFIFFWIYSRAIADGSVSAGRFFVLRFSRLYPLHLVTLLLVAAGQWAYLSANGSYFIYPNNDLYHFVLNLLLLPSVGLERGTSFNSPIWSVSVEVVLYTAFFFYCRLLKPRVLPLAALSLFGLTVLFALYSPIGRGVGSFFLGALVYLGYLRILATKAMSQITRAVVVAAVLAWLATLGVSYSDVLGGLPPKVSKALALFPILVLFPLTVLGLALVETLRGGFAGRVPRFFGDISYSSYLWHFPLQLLCAGLAHAFGVSMGVFASPWVLLAFFVVLLAVSRASYVWLEMPAQRALRARLTGGAARTAPAG